MTNARPLYWVRDPDGNIRGTDDVREWSAMFDAPFDLNRRIAKTDLGDRGTVSTVFLGLDHRFGSEGPPVLWESLVFGGPFDQSGDRYSSEEDALRGHERIVACLRDGLDPGEEQPL